MRKLRRSVERNRAKKVASKAVMTMMAASLAMSDSALVAYAAESSEYVGEVDNEESGVQENTEGTSSGESAEGTSTEETSTEGSADGETSTEGSTDGETSTEGSADGEEATGEESSEEETTEEETTEEETTEEEGNARTRVLRSMRMLGATQTKTTKTVTPNPGDTIDIANVGVNQTTGKIEISIEQDGTYTLKGSNYINGAYVDVQIIVADRVKADLNLDGLSIVNNDNYDTSGFTTCFMGKPSDVVSPIVIKGTANIHVIGDSEIAALTDFFSVDGELNFVDSQGSARLTFLLTAIPTFSYEGASGSAILAEVADCYGSGKVCFKDALVTIKNQTRVGENSYATFDYVNGGNGASDKIYLEGKGVSFEKVRFNQCSVYTSLTNMDGMSFPGASILGLTGGELLTANITGLPANGSIIQMDTVNWRDSMSVTYTKPDGLNVDSEGNFKGVLTEELLYLYVESAGVVKAYKAWSGMDEPYPANELATYCITYIDAINKSTVLDKFYSVENNCIFVPEEDDKYIYSYSLEDGTPLETEKRVDQDTNFSNKFVIKNKYVSGDTKILVTKIEKGKVTLTVDGTTKLVEYGKTLAELGYSGYYMNTVTGKLVSLDERITETLSVRKLNLTTQTKGSTEYFCLSSPASLKDFATLVNSGDTTINGLLTSDITLDSDFDMIGNIYIDGDYFTGSLVSDNAYMGVFDGQGHTVTMNIDKSSEKYVGLFGCVSAGASIKNIVLKGSVRGGNYVGALTGCVFCKDGGAVNIENCINYASVFNSVENGYTAGLVGFRASLRNGNNTMQLSLNHCGNNGTISGSGAFGIFGGNDAFINISIKNSYCSTDNGISGVDVDIVNCYSAGDSGYNGTKVSAEAFESGEVTYLLNNGESAQKWFQTCGTGTPSFSGQTVYAGYSDCVSDVLSYANIAFTHTVPGHEASTSYSYEDGNVLVGCKHCSEKLSASLNFGPEELSGNMQGVTVTYSPEWIAANYPEVVIKYSDAIDGTYSETVPSEVGIWYVKAYVGDDETGVDIDDTYAVLPKKVVDTSSDDSNTTSSEKQEEKFVEVTNKLIESLNAIAEIGAKKTPSNNTQKKETVIEYNAGRAVSSSVIKALKNAEDVTLNVTCYYEGKEYHFEIKGGVDYKFDPTVRWCGPLYLQKMLHQSGLELATANGKHVVSRGDTLFNIARRYGTTVENLLRKNPSIKNPNHISVGQVIKF